MLTWHGRRRLGVLVSIFAVVAMAACATTADRSPKAVTDMGSIAGRWIGTCDLGSGPQPCNMTITPDGSFAATAGATTRNGRVTVAGGKATFDVGTAGGDIVLYEADGKRQIVVTSTRGIARGQLTPQ